MASLKEIQPMVQDVAEAISAALGVEVEIVDEELTVIAGSGYYKERIGDILEYGKVEGNYLYARTLRQQSASVVTDPAGDPNYDPSSLKGMTRELGEICSPIFFKEQAIGVIGLSALNKEQRKKLFFNKDAILNFLKHMSHLLSVKLSESETMDRLSTLSRELKVVLETIHEGALAINSDGLVTHCNTKAAKLLGASPDEIIGNHIGEFWDKPQALEVLKTNRPYTEREEIYHTRQKHMHFIVSVRPIPGKSGPEGTVISFRDIAEARRLVHDLSNQRVQYTFDHIIGQSASIRQVKEQALHVARGNSTVLITGESGTGKEIFARAIHGTSFFDKGPFISVNCGAIPETLLESELFGYEGGAFTGAHKDGKAGKFELAVGGTIFLDEIGEMPLHLQVKLLHVLQNRHVERIGGNKKIPVNVRIIAASNRDLEMMLQEGNFRKDLYFRLSVIPLHIPPLKDRREDIPLLVEHCLEKYCRMLDNNDLRVDHPVMDCYLHYPWPGNVRELENAVEYSVNMTHGELIKMENTPPRIRSFDNSKRKREGSDLQTLVKNFERDLLNDYLNKYGTSYYSKMSIARELNISRATLYRKLTELDLS